MIIDSYELFPLQVILPLADICLPNQFEAELLTERKIRTEEEAREVMDLLHSRGPHTVILSSTELGSQNFLLGLASRVIDGVKTVVRVEIPKFPAAFVGEEDQWEELNIFLETLTSHQGEAAFRLIYHGPL